MPIYKIKKADFTFLGFSTVRPTLVDIAFFKTRSDMLKFIEETGQGWDDGYSYSPTTKEDLKLELEVLRKKREATEFEEKIISSYLDKK